MMDSENNQILNYMPVRIIDLSKKLGLENKEVLAKAKLLGISAAKVPSSSLDKISAEYLEEELLKPHQKPQITVGIVGPEIYRFIDQILSGQIQLKINVSESENAVPIHLCLVKDTVPKGLDTKTKSTSPVRIEITDRIKDLLRAAYYSSRHNSVDGWVNLAEYGSAVKRLDPTFQPQDFGERSLGSLLRRAGDIFDLRNDESNPIVYHLRIKLEALSPAPITMKQELQATLPKVQKLARGKIHNLRLGFGFIMPDDSSENLFFHATDVEGCTIFDLKPGDAVEYEPGVNEKGPCGRKVQRIE